MVDYFVRALRGPCLRKGKLFVVMFVLRMVSCAIKSVCISCQSVSEERLSAFILRLRSELTLTLPNGTASEETIDDTRALLVELAWAQEGPRVGATGCSGQRPRMLATRR